MSDLAPAPAPFTALLEAQALAESILRRHLADLDAQPVPPSAPVLANAILSLRRLTDNRRALLRMLNPEAPRPPREPRPARPPAPQPSVSRPTPAFRPAPTLQPARSASMPRTPTAPPPASSALRPPCAPSVALTVPPPASPDRLPDSAHAPASAPSPLRSASSVPAVALYKSSPAITAANSVHDALVDLLEAQGLIRPVHPIHPDDAPADFLRHDRPHVADDPLPGINSSPALASAANPARACTARSP